MTSTRGTNPFYHRSPIADPAHFHGRVREIDFLLGRTAAASKPQCVSVVGSRRMGKSSLLRQLVDHRGPAAPAPDGLTVFAYHDLEGSGSLTVERFFRTLARRVERAVAKQAPTAPPPPAAAPADAEEAFSDRIEDLSEEGVRIVLCLDEFDTVTLNANFDADLFGRLRYLTNTCQLAWITSSYAELTELCHQEEIRQSPFFNVFTTLPLGLLTPRAMRDLVISESAAAGSPFSDAEVALLQELAGCQPFHVQQAATAVWEAEPGDAAAARAAFLHEAVPHFRYAREHLTPEQDAVLLAIARGEASPDDASDPVVAWLLRRGLAILADEGPQPFSPAFSEWLDSAPAGAEHLSTRVGRRHLSSTSEEAGDLTATHATILPQAGTLLEDRYEIRGELGRGGFGVVLSALDRRLGRDVAIKILRSDRHEAPKSGEYRDRFLREARAASQVTHPNVIALHDIREQGEDLYVVMELFHGRALRAHLDEHAPLPPAEAVALALQAARGLGAAHARGIVHRDVKPENLLVDETGWLKLVDFGLAFFAEAERITSSGVAVLTPRYSSPEQIKDEQITARSDVFSLGCVMHEMLTGRFTFDGSSTSAVLFQILADRPDVPSALPEAIPSVLRHLVAACLNRDPAARPASCTQLAEALEEVAARLDGS